MSQSQKPIQLSGHALEQLQFRGATEEDVTAAIRNAPWREAESGRLECRQDFTFTGEWNGKLYTTRQVRPIFVEEPDAIVVVTVYVYYF